MPRVEYDKAKIEEHKLEIQRILDVLRMPDLPLAGNGGVDEPMNADSLNVATTAENGGSFPCLDRSCVGC